MLGAEPESLEAAEAERRRLGFFLRAAAGGACLGLVLDASVCLATSAAIGVLALWGRISCCRHRRCRRPWPSARTSSTGGVHRCPSLRPRLRCDLAYSFLEPFTRSHQIIEVAPNPLWYNQDVMPIRGASSNACLRFPLSIWSDSRAPSVLPTKKSSLKPGNGESVTASGVN